MTEDAKARPAKNEYSAEIAVTTEEGVKTAMVVFNTPKLLEEVNKAPDASKVKISVRDERGTSMRVLVDDDKQKVIEILQASIVPYDKLVAELRKFTQFLLEHSSLKAVGVHAVCVDDDDKDTGFGFISTAHDCNTAQAVALINCGDANIDEFISKAKLHVPGRNGVPEKGTVITPTEEQVKQLS